jgi:hypothetical protein
MSIRSSNQRDHLVDLPQHHLPGGLPRPPGCTPPTRRISSDDAGGRADCAVREPSVARNSSLRESASRNLSSFELFFGDVQHHPVMPEHRAVVGIRCRGPLAATQICRPSGD